jgi:AraC-like DNA-binding protein
MQPLRAKKIIYMFLILWGISLTIFHFEFSYQELRFDKFASTIETHSDKSENGISEVGVSQTGDTLGLWYELRTYPDSVSWPWVNVKILFDDFIDVSNYDYIELEVKNSKPNKIAFSVGVNYPDGTDLPFHSLTQGALVDSQYSTAKLPLTSFTSGNWWLERKQIKEIKPEDVNFKEFLSFDIGAGNRSQHYEREHISLHSMRFTKYLFWPYFVFGGLFILFIIALVFSYIKRQFKIKSERKVVINYAKTLKHPSVKTPSAVEYVHNNYNNSEITLSGVSKLIGLSESKISLEMKTKTTLTFKKYLNKIRIDEAEILLTGSSVKISIVAEKVGYDNVTNFNRVFKNVNNMSPSEYRSSFKSN